MTTLEDLISRIEAASGPDRVLDAAIAQTVGADHGPRETVYHESRSIEYHAEVARAYTASIDAALTLVPEGAGIDLRICLSGYGIVTLYPVNFAKPGVEARAETAPLALCLAALRTLTPGDRL